MLQSTTSFLMNMGCNMNAAGDYCMAVVYDLFAHLGLAATMSLEGLPPVDDSVALDSSSNDDAPVVFTLNDCTAIAETAGCCLGSLINVRYPAGFVFYNLHTAMAVSDMAEQCQALGVNVTMTPCNGSSVDLCTQPLLTIPEQCQAFALGFPELVSSAGHTMASNAQLCTDPCFAYMPDVEQAIINHPGNSHAQGPLQINTAPQNAMLGRRCKHFRRLPS